MYTLGEKFVASFWEAGGENSRLTMVEITGIFTHQTLKETQVSYSCILRRLDEDSDHGSIKRSKTKEELDNAVQLASRIIQTALAHQRST